jgi:hypothetical protein
MFEDVPTLELEGVPLRVPLVVLKVAHDGRLLALKTSVVPAGPLALGVKE